MADQPKQMRTGDIARYATVVVSIALAFFVVAAVLWIASTAVIAFAVGIVLAVVLDTGARGLHRFLPIGHSARLAIVILIAALLLAAAIWWGGALLSGQFNDLLFALRKLGNEAQGFVKNSPLFPTGATLRTVLPAPGTIVGGATTVLPLAFTWLSIAAAILFIGPFLAWEPQVYKRALLNLVPPRNRARVDEVLDEAGASMRSWLLGQSISMVVIFLFSLCALTVIAMPYAVVLAVQAGLLTFIPTLGPFIAGVVIMLAGLSVSPTMALYGLLTYVIIQFLESNLVTPVVQERTVHMPPALTLVLQLIAGFLFGLLGLAFVVPIAAAAKTIILELYVNDYLGGGCKTEHRGHRSGLAGIIDRFLPR